ncbi:hypothetical protein WJX72_000937 [[Myrmecia] bisecta]|uniref:Gfo/Idh/MocA-like oxidoreductase N-terminal domain-containing protein n=1 Tax=[Myrmecia] bisecta TaxID=41462 RepID=A0AAW1Q841_9CHLO
MREEQKHLLACTAAGAAAGLAALHLYRQYALACSGPSARDTHAAITPTKPPPASERTATVASPAKPAVPPTPVEGAATVAIVGTGWGIKVQTPTFQQCGIRLGAVYSRDPKRASEVAKQHGFDRGYSDVKELCENEKVDVVSVVTPVIFHCDQAIEALAAGKHVLCDKPMALNAAEAEKMMAASRAHPMQVAIMEHELRFTPMLQVPRAHLQKGTIGVAKYVEDLATMPDVFAGGWTWWVDREAGGGAWGALGSHIIDALSLTKTLKDKETKKDKPVTADDYASIQSTLVPSNAKTLNDKIWGLGQHQSAEVHITLAMVGQAAPTSTMLVTGSKGSITIDVNTSSCQVVDAKQKVVAEVKGKGNAAMIGTRLLGEALQKAFGPEKDRSALDAAAQFEDGLAVQYVLDAGWESSDQGGAKVTPKVAATNCAAVV